jgi:small subunit ribosomal protein S11
MAYSKSNSARLRKRNKRVVTDGVVHISASFNNTLITITDRAGNTLLSASGGTAGFKGSRKSTPFAAQMASESIASVARDEWGMKTLIVYVKGPGPGRDSALRALGAVGFRILFIKDKSSNPHGGTRSPKKRRV